MRHWSKLGEAPIPGAGRSLVLHRDRHDFYIHISGGGELMSSRKHGSEDALAYLPCRKLADPENARVLVGGLGMGFTLAAALAEVGKGAVVTVAELIPEVIEWNRGPLGDCSGRPLEDPRTRVFTGDVAELLAARRDGFDVIALDVDNGPEGLTQGDNDRLYGIPGIVTAKQALRPGGVLAYWSASREPAFRKRLAQCGLQVEETMVYAHGSKGARHCIWLAWQGSGKKQAKKNPGRRRPGRSR